MNKLERLTEEYIKSCEFVRGCVESVDSLRASVGNGEAQLNKARSDSAEKGRVLLGEIGRARDSKKEQ